MTSHLAPSRRVRRNRPESARSTGAPGGPAARSPARRWAGCLGIPLLLLVLLATPGFTGLPAVCSETALAAPLLAGETDATGRSRSPDAAGHSGEKPWSSAAGGDAPWALAELRARSQARDARGRARSRAALLGTHLDRHASHVAGRPTILTAPQQAP